MLKVLLVDDQELFRDIARSMFSTTDDFEIIAEAEKLGTFQVSIMPHDDCCSYLMPRDVETHATPEMLDRAEAGLDVERLVQDACEQAEAVEFYYEQAPVETSEQRQ